MSDLSHLALSHNGFFFDASTGSPYTMNGVAAAILQGLISRQIREGVVDMLQAGTWTSLSAAAVTISTAMLSEGFSPEDRPYGESLLRLCDAAVQAYRPGKRVPHCLRPLSLLWAFRSQLYSMEVMYPDVLSKGESAGGQMSLEVTNSLGRCLVSKGNALALGGLGEKLRGELDSGVGPLSLRGQQRQGKFHYRPCGALRHRTTG